GPVHAAAYGAELGIRSVYVFPMSPMFSAFGVASSDVVHTKMITRHLVAPIDMAALNREIAALQADLGKVMKAEGFPENLIGFRRTVYMRYTRQVNEVPVQIPPGALERADRREIEQAFNAKYEEMYGRGAGHPEAGIEIISIAIDALGNTVKPMLPRTPIVGPDSSGAKKGSRRAYFTGANPGFKEAAVYDYTRLKAGNLLAGPAIIETPFTTVIVPESHTAEVDEFLNVILRH
ncbi:MAG: hypothetical protein JWM36_547, partial [Hyphomicrobiales bacterium]|nr:hypothetical protein [Hyphomicrobiales bacterium]